MLYIKEISKDKNYFKVIYSIERKDIEFIWKRKTIVDAIKRGHKYMTVFEENGKLVEGAKIHLHESFESNGRIHPDYLMTYKNDKLEDNLSELPNF